MLYDDQSTEISIKILVIKSFFLWQSPTESYEDYSNQSNKCSKKL